MSSARAAALAARFEEAHGAFLNTIEGLPEDVWLGPCPGEERPVCAVAHHIADGFGGQLIALRRIAAGDAFVPLSREALDGANAERAGRDAGCSRAEVAALAQRRATRVGAFVRGLADEQLGRTGVYVDWLPAMTLDELVERILIGHVDGHLRGIQEAAAPA